MAQLNSPGVSVTVIDESFYTPSAPGTVPLIVVASEENKANGSGSGVAPGTLKANAGQVYLLTSQRDLSDTFGTPVFHTDANNNPIHAGELNEYGLQAAYSYLGVSNSAYVVRADVDLSELTGQAEPPAGLPVDGTTWIDTANTNFGVFEWNATTQSFSHKIPSVIIDTNKIDNPTTGKPIAGYGTSGTYAISATTNLLSLWYKRPAVASMGDGATPDWVEVGTTGWINSRPTVINANTTFTLPATPLLSINNGTTTYPIISALTSPLPTTVSDIADMIIAANITGVSVYFNASTGKLELYSARTLTFSGNAAASIGFLETAYLPPALQISAHYNIPPFSLASFNPSTANGRATGSVWVKTTPVNYGANWSIKRYSSTQASWISSDVPVYADNASALATLDPSGGKNIAANSMYIKYNDSEATGVLANFKLYRRSIAGATSITSSIITASTFTPGHDYTFTIAETLVGSNVLGAPQTITINTTSTPALSAVAVAYLVTTQIHNAGLVNIDATVTSDNRLVITHLAGGDFVLANVSASPYEPLSALFSTTTTLNYYNHPSDNGKFLASNWSSTVLGTTNSFSSSSNVPPVSLTASDTLWYDNSITDIDIMIHDGSTWRGYTSYISSANPAGPIVSATAPITQTDNSPLVTGDLWISTADMEKFPQIYKYNTNTSKWTLVDNTDQTTENGVLFHDARWSTSGVDSEPASIVNLLSSNYLDPDAPDPAIYPHGMLLWNLRRSGNNVKRFVRNYIDNTETNPRQSDAEMTNYYAHRWVSEAANQADGSGSFGRIAQRTVVLQSLTALINSNQQIRDEDSRIFNLIAAPGYPELIKPLVGLNYDRGLTAFVVGDTPARLTPDATTLSNWGQNVNNALEDNEVGLVTTDPYLGVFYPWGYTTDNVGNHIAVPPSHIMLRTIALSDNVSYPWFAPAGVRRGGITNASAVGYITAEGEFQATALNNGQRDVLANIHVNPLTYISGTGLVNYGQKTRQLVASAMDRINVARLVIYMRVQLSRIAKPYIFEPNDRQTRNELKQQIESFLLELVGQRALYDFVVVCDTSNNTPARIDRNELYVDIAIEPVKAVEFIYIPLRLENTGAIAKLG